MQIIESTKFLIQKRQQINKKLSIMSVGSEIQNSFKLIKKTINDIELKFKKLNNSVDLKKNNQYEQNNIKINETLNSDKSYKNSFSDKLDFYKSKINNQRLNIEIENFEKCKFLSKPLKSFINNQIKSKIYNKKESNNKSLSTINNTFNSMISADIFQGYDKEYEVDQDLKMNNDLQTLNNPKLSIETNKTQEHSENDQFIKQKQVSDKLKYKILDKQDKLSLNSTLTKASNINLEEINTSIIESKESASKINKTCEFDDLQQELKLHPDIGILINQEGKIIQQNKCFRMKLRQNSTECLKSNLKVFIHFDDQNEFTSALELFIRKRDRIIHSVQCFDTINSESIVNEPIVIRVCDKNKNYSRFQVSFQSVSTTLIESNTNEPIPLINVKMMSQEQIQQIQIIDPRSIQQIFWILVMFLTLMWILWNSTLELGFVTIFELQPNSYKFEFWNTVIITILFSIDTVQNFFLAYEDEENFEFDHQKIVHNQTLTQFIFDIISTIPFDLFMTLSISPQNLKLVKSIKLIKLLRLAKIQSLSQLGYIQTNNQFEQLASFLKRNSGFFELLYVLSFLILLNHFQTCIFFQLKQEIWDSYSLDWLQTYQLFNGQDKNAQTLQVKIYCMMLQTALGIVSGKAENPFEIVIETIWVILGLAIFGQSVGNISAYLNVANKRENEMNETINQFKDLMIETNCMQLHPLILNDIEDQYKNYNINEFNRTSAILSKNIKQQLETSIYREFIESHPIFEQLSIEVIRKLKFCKIKSNMQMLRNNEILHSVYFILEGNVKILDNNLGMLNEQKAGEILGMHHFKEQYQLKYRKDLDSLLDNSQDKIHKSKSKILDQMGHNIMKKLNDDFEMVYNNIEVKCKQYAVCDQHTHQLEVPFEYLEEIYKLDIESFKLIQHESQASFETIDRSKIIQSNNTQFSFDNHELAGIMFKPEGDIQDINFECINRLHIRNQHDQNLFDILQYQDVQDKTQTRIRKIEEITNGRYALKLGNNFVQIQQDSITEALMARNSKDKPQQKLKKSLVDVRIFQFDIKESQ